MRCEHCGTENVDGARFCKGCGADLTQQNELRISRLGAVT